MSPSGSSAAEQLLLKFGLDLSPVKDGAKAIKAALEELNKIADEVAKKSAASVASTKKEFDAIKTSAQAAAATQKQQAAAQASQLAGAQAITAEEQKRTAEILAQNEALKKQVEELKKHQEENKKKPPKEEEGGFLSQVGKKVAGTLGGSLGSAMAAGGVAGLVGAGAEKAIDLVGELVEKFKEAIMESDKFIGVWNAFSIAATQAGTTAVGAMDKMKEAVDGTVSRIELARSATLAFNNTALNENQLSDLMRSVKEAGEVYSSGGEALQALNRAMQTGNVRALALATGLSRQADRITRDLVPAYSKEEEIARRLLYLKTELEKHKGEGEALSTIDATLAKIKALATDIFTAFGSAFVKSKGMQDLLKALDELVKSLGFIVNDAAKAGKALGDAFGSTLADTIHDTAAEIDWIARNLEKIKNFGKIPALDYGERTKALAKKYPEEVKPEPTPEEKEKADAEAAAKEKKRRFEEDEEHKAFRLQMAALDDQISKATADKDLARRKDALQLLETTLTEAQRIEDRYYAQGEVALEEHTDRQKRLIESVGTVKEATAKAQTQSDLADIDRQIAAQKMIQSAYPGLGGEPSVRGATAAKQIKLLQAQRQKAEQDGADKLVQIRQETNQKIAVNQEHHDDDYVKEQTELATRVEKIQRDAIERLNTANEQRFAKDGTLADDYFERQRRLIDADRDAQIIAIQTIAKLHANDVNWQRRAEEQIVDLKIAAETKKTAVTETEAKKRQEALDREYGADVQRAQGRLQRAKTTPQGGEMPSQYQAVQNVIENLGTQITMQEIFLKTLKAGTNEYKTADERLKDMRQQMVLLNEEARKLLDNTTQIGNIYSTLGGGISAVFRSSFARNLGASISAGGRAFSLADQRTQAMTTTAGPGATSAEQLKIFGDKLQAAVGAVADFITSMTNATSALSGALGGAGAGAGLGQVAGGLAGSIFKSLGASAGPIGAAIGATIGTVMGAIVGSKNAQVKRQIDALNVTFQAINQGLKENANNLQLTINQMQGLLQLARQQQASSKKGSSEFQKNIDQYIQTINDLKIQQEGVIREMNQQIAVLQSPEGMRDYLNNLKSIYDQYNKFAGAAQNVNDLAKANEFLALSLQQYSITLQRDFNSANLDAVNDALKLNDLLYQRQQLIIQINDQIRSVLTQGIVSRMPTRAQTAGEQIAQIKLQTDRQMEQLNAQIQATQYRVSIEQQIFNLATTRVGLEMQLVGLQGQQTDQDMQRIQALSNLIDEIKNGGPNVAALLGTLQGATSPYGPISKGNIVLDQAFSTAYASRSTIGYGNYRAQNL